MTFPAFCCHYIINSEEVVTITQPFYKVREVTDMRNLIETSVELYGDRPAFEIKRNNLHYFVSYKEYLKDINAFCTTILSEYGENTRVGIMSDNRYEYALTYFATVTAGSVVVPIDKELHFNDVLGILKVSEVKILFVDKRQLKRIDFDVLKELGVRVVSYSKLAARDYEGVTPFDEFIAVGRRLNREGNRLYLDVRQDINKLAVLLFTSGTTGASKGVMLCQRNFLFEIKGALGVLKIYPEDCCISLLPFHHTFESSIVIFFAPFCGAKITFCEGFKYVLRNMKEFNPSVFVAVPQVLETVHKRILKEIKKKNHGEQVFKAGKVLCRLASKVHIDLKKVVFKEIQDTFGGNMRLIICGGAPIDPQILEDFNSFGIQVLFGYGLTECAPLCMINHDRCRTTDSIGEPLPGIETKIINQDENGIGELCVKGGNVMLGYYQNPEATAEVIDEDDFFHTGDLAYEDDKGRFHITGRSKNVIVTSNGKNIYPEELEYHLQASPLVESCMVEGVMVKGEIEVHAQIYPDKEEVRELIGPNASAEQIRNEIGKVVASVNSILPSFKTIRSFTIREEDFVKTTAMKIKREVNKTVGQE